MSEGARAFFFEVITNNNLHFFERVNFLSIIFSETYCSVFKLLLESMTYQE